MANLSKDAENALENNPCGMCRALGLPSCKGHAGGGGGGDEAEDSYESTDSSSPSYQPSPVEIVTLSSFLDKRNAWQQSNEDDLLYTYNNDLAVLTLSLDLSKGVIKFEGQQFLSQDKQDELDALYETITTELAHFKNELNANNIKLDATVNRKGNDLTIKISDPKQYDAFISRLMEKNLLPTQQIAPALKPSAKSQEKTSDLNAESDSYKSPTLFDISSGPKPPGGK